MRFVHHKAPFFPPPRKTFFWGEEVYHKELLAKVMGRLAEEEKMHAKTEVALFGLKRFPEDRGALTRNSREFIGFFF